MGHHILSIILNSLLAVGIVIALIVVVPIALLVKAPGAVASFVANRAPAR